MSLEPPHDCSRFLSFPSFGDSGNAVSRHYLAVSLSISRRIFETLHASIATLNFHSIGLGSAAILQFPRTNFTLASAQWKEPFNILREDFNTRYRYSLSRCVNVEHRTLRWRLWTSMRFNSAAILRGCISLLFRQTKRKSILISGGKTLNAIRRIVTLFRYVVKYRTLRWRLWTSMDLILCCDSSVFIAESRCFLFRRAKGLLISWGKTWIQCAALLRYFAMSIIKYCTLRWQLWFYMDFKLPENSILRSYIFWYSTEIAVDWIWLNIGIRFSWDSVLSNLVFRHGDSWICYPWKQLLRRKYSHL